MQWWLDEINWNHSCRMYTGKNVKIAVIDTFVDVTHSDLRHLSIKQYPKNADTDHFTQSNSNHATGIVGIIAAYPSSCNGILGIAYNAEIISIDIQKNNSVDQVDVIDLVNAINDAILLDVDIINISLGTATYSSELKKAIYNAINKNIVIVSAAGNHIANKILYPAAFENVIAVGALSKNGEKISPIGDTQKEIVFLPGENIVTIAPDNSYASMFGTSASTAIMTGICALLIEANPALSVKSIYEYFSKIQRGIDVCSCLKDIKEM